MRYRIELEPGRFANPHFFTGFDSEGNPTYSTFTFRSWKVKANARAKLALIERVSKSHWGIDYYDEENDDVRSSG